jgi:hypothetical protein
MNLTENGLTTPLVPGITIALTNLTDNYTYTVGPTGYLEKAISGDYIAKKSKGDIAQALALHTKNNTSFTIEIKIFVGNTNVLLFYTDGKDNPVKAKLTNGILAKKVNLQKGENGVYRTATATDTIRYAWIDTENNLLRFGNICVVSQNKSLFLSVQEVYVSELGYFRSGTKIVFPRLETEKPQYPEFWRTHLNWKGIIAKKADTYVAPKAFDYSSLKKNQAYVNFFSVAKRTGMATIINSKSGEPMSVKIHYSQIFVNDETLAELATGEIVSFQSVRQIENTGNRTSSFRFELTGICKKK